MRKNLLLCLTALLISCGTEPLDTTYDANKNTKLLELRSLNVSDRQAIFKDFYKMNKKSFGELSEDSVASCLSDSVHDKNDDFSLAKIANWCKAAFLQGRDFSKYKNYEVNEINTTDFFSLKNLQSTIRSLFVKQNNDIYSAHFTSDSARLLLGVGDVKKFNDKSLTKICADLDAKNLGIAVHLLSVEIYQLSQLNELMAGKRFEATPALAMKCSQQK